MQTRLAEFINDTPLGREADAVLRRCVHCGFCNATCPTYRLLGDELDGPRGRIYLIKQVLEGREPTRKTQVHLDRCLTCAGCETTCPSGVEYGRLVDIGRELVDERVARPWRERTLRRALRFVLPYRSHFTPLLRIGQLLRPLLPERIRNQVPARSPAIPWPENDHSRRMLILKGCVQPALAPRIDAAAAQVLDTLGIRLIPAGGCCGALSQHLTAPAEARRFMRANIDAWWPHIEAGAEAIVMTASGCGAVVKNYGEYLKDDPDYAEKATRVSNLTRDLSEVLRDEDLSRLPAPPPRRIAFHPPCTLQHTQRIKGVVEDILARTGFELVPVRDAHLCCGSAGTYSILQSELSRPLLKEKLANLQHEQPEVIASANIGCLTYLQTQARAPVVHWIELLADPGTAQL